MKTIITTLAALCVAFAASSSGFADEGMKTRQLVVGNPFDNQLAYFSPRLGARFAIHTVQIPGFSPFRAARLVSRPEQGSPLAQLGLRQGDVITRLDGIPASNLQQLEQHILDTTVRFVRAGSQAVQEGTIMIDPGYLFQDPYSTADNSSGGPLAP